MADLIKKIKIKKQDGTFTNYIPIGAEARDVSMQDGENVENKINNNIKNISFLSNNNADNIITVENTEDIYDSQFLLINSNLTLSKEDMLTLQSKNVHGSGTVLYDSYWLPDNSLINGVAKVEYLNRPVYMSMKNPSDTTNPNQSYRVNGTLTSNHYRAEGFDQAHTIGAIYAHDYASLPETFDVYIGRVRTYLLFDDDESWTLHEDYNSFTSGFHTFTLPWATSVSTDFTNFTQYPNYTVLHLTKEDLNSKTIHFWAQNDWKIDCSKVRGAVSMYEAWTNIDNLQNNVYCAIGIDQEDRTGTSPDKNQLFSGRNFGLTTTKQIIVGHAIPETEYQKLIDDISLDPDKLYFNFANESYDHRGDDNAMASNCPFAINLGACVSEKYVEILSYDLSDIDAAYFLNIDLNVLLSKSLNDSKSYDIIVQIKHSAGLQPNVVIFNNTKQDIVKGYIYNNKFYLYFYSSDNNYVYPIITFKSFSGYLNRLSLSELIQERYSSPIYGGSRIPDKYLKNSVSGDIVSTVFNNIPERSITDTLSLTKVNDTTIDYSYNGYNYFAASDITGLLTSGRYIVEYIASTTTPNSLYALQRFTLVNKNVPELYFRVLNNGTWSSLIKII